MKTYMKSLVVPPEKVAGLKSQDLPLAELLEYTSDEHEVKVSSAK